MMPALAVGGVMRGLNNGRVNEQIETRQTLLPLEVQGDEETRLDVFFPLVPSPQHVEIVYVDPQGEHTLIIDTQAALDGLHLVQANK